MNTLNVRDAGDSKVLLEVKVNTTKPYIKIKCVGTDRYGRGSGVEDVVVDTKLSYIYFEQSKTNPCRLWYYTNKLPDEWTPIMHFDVDKYREATRNFFLAQTQSGHLKEEATTMDGVTKYTPVCVSSRQPTQNKEVYPDSTQGNPYFVSV